MTLDMTRGRPSGLLIRFALPLMLSSLLQQLYTMCDSMIMGQMLGTEAFAAIGSAAYLQWFPLSMLLGCTQGFGVPLAQRYGARDMAGFRRFLTGGILLTALVGTVLSVGGVCMAEQMLTLLQTPSELMALCARYLRVLWSGLLTTAMLNILSSALRAMGDSRTPFYGLILSTVLNIALDYLFLAGLHMGVAGAALATVLSQAAACGWCLRGLLRVRDAVPARSDWKLRRPVVRELLRLGVPPLICNAITSTGELLVLRAINLFGVAFVTGMSASRRYFSLLNIVGSAMQGSVATYVGQNYGAREKARVVRGVRVAVLMELAAALLTGIAVTLAAKPLILLFIPDGTEEMIRFGTESLRVQALFVSGLSLLCTYRAAIQGTGTAILPMLSGFLELVLRAGGALLLPMWFGQTGLYYTDAVTWVLTTILLWISYQVIRRRRLQ